MYTDDGEDETKCIMCGRGETPARTATERDHRDSRRYRSEHIAELTVQDRRWLAGLDEHIEVPNDIYDDTLTEGNWNVASQL